ncbi:MAG: phosphotransferase [Actinomycetota bacterium]|nr:phosphotransferase [Actinomycetota bacterium]
MTTGRADEPEQAALSRLLAMSLTRLATPGEYHNQHFQGRGRSGTRVFVKLFDDAGYWTRAIRAAPLAELYGGRTPQLLDHGELAPDRWWLVYEWVELAEFRPTVAHIVRAGELLGRLHRATTGLHLDRDFRRHDLDEEITARVSALHSLDPAAADRVRTLRSRWEDFDLTREVCVIHGDVHWRNLGIDPDGGIVLYDWENTASGHPLLDFGKLIDLPLIDPTDRRAFMHGYQLHANQLYPWPDAVALVRLWTTVGVLVYALSRGLPDFAAHGYAVLRQLEHR